MKPFRHARNSARHFGGVPEDYMPIHDFLDQSKMTIADMRHRALFHNTLGPYLVEQVFGKVVKNSAGRSYSPRDVAEQHIFEDLGTIPPVSAYLNNMAIQGWMGGPRRKRPWKKKMPIKELETLGEDFERRKRAFTSEAQALLGKAFAEYFEKYGDKVAALYWDQYTPYFNDGEPCEFSVHELEIAMARDGVDPDDEDFDPEEYDHEGGYIGRGQTTEPEGFERDAAAIHSFLEKNEEIAKDAYGDHVRIIVTAKGARTLDYEHD